MNFEDTFIDAGHIRESFPEVPDIAVEAAHPGEEIRSYQLTFHYRAKASANKKTPSTSSSSSSTGPAVLQRIQALPIRPSLRGPYPENIPPRNTVRFTPAQIQAIHNGMKPGLSLIVGPPGTGKTDVAVQIISNLYHNYPTQKIVIVTHSNAALNDIFEKIMSKDIDPRHLLRLGSGESDLRESLLSRGNKASALEMTFSKQGRVNWSLARRLQLLGQVTRLASSLQLPGDVGHSCETAAYFFTAQIKPRIEAFQSSNGAEPFPFQNFFADVPDLSKDPKALQGCIQYVMNIFTELEDYRAFELLRTLSLRSDYLLTKQVRLFNPLTTAEPSIYVCVCMYGIYTYIYIYTSAMKRTNYFLIPLV